MLIGRGFDHNRADWMQVHMGRRADMVPTLTSPVALGYVLRPNSFNEKRSIIEDIFENARADISFTSTRLTQHIISSQANS